MLGLAILVVAAAVCSSTPGALADGKIRLAQATTPNVATPFTGLSSPVTSTVTNCMMSCNSVGELPNELRRSGAAAGDAFRNRDFERDGEHVVLVRLLFEPTCMSDELRPAIAFAINKSPAALVLHNVGSNVGL
jgi:hypothetical protein